MSDSPAQVSYTEDNIRSLDWKEHIRMRPGMYIGKLGDGQSADDGIYVLLKEIIDNCIDEHAMGHGKSVKVVIRDSPKRMLCRTSSSDKPSATRTWLGLGCSLEQALPALAAMPIRESSAKRVEPSIPGIRTFKLLGSRTPESSGGPFN